MTTLGDITAPKVEQSGPPKSGEFIYVDISSIDNSAKRIVEPKRLPVEGAPSRARQCLAAGDVLVSMTRPNLNAVALVPTELDGAVGSTGFHVLRADEGTEPRWLYYAVQSRSFVQAMSEVVQGALYPAVRPKDIRTFEVNPPSVDEQRRIVAEIEKQFSRLDEAVAGLLRVQANLKRYKAAVLKAAVEGRLVPTEADLARGEGRSYETGAQLLQRILETRRSQWQGKGKYKEPTAPDTAGLPALPDGWVWTGLEQVSQANKYALKAGPFGSALKKEHYAVSGYKIYGQEQVIRGDHRFGDYYIGEEKFRELESCAVKPGDLLISLVGTAGKVLVLPDNVEPGIINPRLLKLSLNSTFVVPSYAAYMLQSVWAAQFFKEQAHGGTMEILNLGIVKMLPVPLPPISEQHRIVAEVDRRLSIVREVEAEVDANLKRAQALRQAVLSKSFQVSPS
ncbi:MAG: restriction endonuclease subunit S [Rhodocyclaceae bacterium]|nr:restriction endonuclease subunit S [Rhodocyclaceae bacterium]